MSANAYLIPPAIDDYLRSLFAPEPDTLRLLREETATHPLAIMQISPAQGRFMALLVELMGAKRTLEVGTFTGASALWVALALPEDGRVVACDVSEEFTSVARRYWKDANVAHKIDLRLGPATDTLTHLLECGQSERFDFAFIDADKPSYDRYYEQCLQLVRPGGLILVDNTLQRGKVADPTNEEENTLALRALNTKLSTDERVLVSMLPFADGLTLALKR